MKTFTIPAQLTSYASTADKGLRLVFRTQETSPDDTVAIAGFLQGFGYLLFKENEWKDEELPKEDAPEFGKTASERLRNVMYRVHQQLVKENRAPDDFERWRVAEMERIIEHFKAKLPNNF
jgi:hypothetical protein